MTTVTVTITDNGDSLELEGKLDNPEALNNPPTPALIVGSYLAANVDQVCKDAMAWFRGMSTAPQQPVEDAAIKAPQIILPDSDVKGYPV